MEPNKKLYRSNNKMLAGVCAGLADYFSIDPTIVRVAYVALSIFCIGFPGLLLYIIMALIMPSAPNSDDFIDRNNN